MTPQLPWAAHSNDQSPLSEELFPNVQPQVLLMQLKTVQDLSWHWLPERRDWRPPGCTLLSGSCKETLHIFLMRAYDMLEYPVLCVSPMLLFPHSQTSMQYAHNTTHFLTQMYFPSPLLSEQQQNFPPDSVPAYIFSIELNWAFSTWLTWIFLFIY